MNRELIFVTGNAHKLEEVQALMGSDFILKSLPDIGCFDDIAETGSTFHENASLKSRYIYDKYKRNCFADDSGLEVDALDGEPGLHSAHYSGSRDTTQNLRLVLDKLSGIANRKARFRCVISLILEGEEFFFEGTVEGNILTAPQGVSGFGYDPIFRPDGYPGSFSQMPLTEKNKISHRGRAITGLTDFLNRRLHNY